MNILCKHELSHRQIKIHLVQLKATQANVRYVHEQFRTHLLDKPKRQHNWVQSTRIMIVLFNPVWTISSIIISWMYYYKLHICIYFMHHTGFANWKTICWISFELSLCFEAIIWVIRLAFILYGKVTSKLKLKLKSRLHVRTWK